MKILHKRTGETIFECGCRTLKKCLVEAVKNKVNLSYADLSNANLRGADLSNADLRGAKLWGANLSNADLSNANLWGEKITKCPIYINAGLHWQVWITDKRIKIGCQIHTTKAWENFTDEQISKMDENALEFWKVWEKPILAMARVHQESEEK